MTFTAVKLKWAKRVLQSKYFVILTDKHSVIALQDANPDTFTDRMALAAQAGEVREFHSRLGALIKRHDAALEKLSVTSTNPTKRVVKKPVKTTKIPVKHVK